MSSGFFACLKRCLAALIVVSGTIAAVSAAEGPSEDYDRKLLRLAEVLGAVHHLRAICGADEGQLWREQMMKLLRAENPSLAFRARLVRSFNQGYRGYKRTYKTCNRAATLAVTRFIREGAALAQSLARERLN